MLEHVRETAGMESVTIVHLLASSTDRRPRSPSWTSLRHKRV
jgi:hypothetical protein